MTQRLYRETGKSGDGPTTLVDATKVVQRLADAIGDSWMSLQQESGKNWKWMRQSSTAETIPSMNAHSASDLLVSSFTRWRPFSHRYTVRAYDTTDTTNVWDLAWLEIDDFKRYYVDNGTADAAPSSWSIDDSDRLMVGPAGDVSYGLRFDYVSAPTELLLDEDEPAMPSRHHMILVWRALIDAGKDVASAEKVSRAIDRYNEMRSALIADQAEQIQMYFPPLA